MDAGQLVLDGYITHLRILWLSMTKLKSIAIGVIIFHSYVYICVYENAGALLYIAVISAAVQHMAQWKTVM